MEGKQVHLRQWPGGSRDRSSGRRPAIHWVSSRSRGAHLRRRSTVCPPQCLSDSPRLGPSAPSTAPSGGVPRWRAYWFCSLRPPLAGASSQYDPCTLASVGANAACLLSDLYLADQRAMAQQRSLLAMRRTCHQLFVTCFPLVQIEIVRIPVLPFFYFFKIKKYWSYGEMRKETTFPPRLAISHSAGLSTA